MLNCCAHHKLSETRERSREVLHLPPQKEDQIPADFYATEEITQEIEPGPKTPTEQTVLSLQQRSIRQ
jgi:hypothetical protein